MTATPQGGRPDEPLEHLQGPFGVGAPGLGYREYLAKHDRDAEIWRQVVPGQSGRGLALARWGLHDYTEYQEMCEAVSYGGDPLWIPMVVEWYSLTAMNGFHIGLDPAYRETFHNGEWEHGDDALPMVGITAPTPAWPALSGPWSVSTPEGFYWELMDATSAGGGIEMTMPAHMVLPIEDDAVLAAAQTAIKKIESLWPMDNAGPTTLNYEGFWEGTQDERLVARDAGHADACFESQGMQSYNGGEIETLKCAWSQFSEQCVPCGGGAHIGAVLDSFFESLPYEQYAMDDVLLPHWQHLKQRNADVFRSLLDVMQTERTRGRSWYYSYLQRWSPWGHSSQVPGQHLVQ